ncbi:MAG TPA: DUF4388 domain-containing protein [Anaeromyxobacter sp.]|nr:DUF4388 domain-containing protein [Anaeromyxobacter sp.]
MSRVLLVDDDIAEISAVKRVLSRAGHQPVLATNASDAMAAIVQRRPDLLVISSTCESGEALALARRLPGDPATDGVPLLVLGAADGLPEGARCLERPLDPELLAAEVKGALGVAGEGNPPGTPSPLAAAPPSPAPANKPRPKVPSARPAQAARGPLPSPAPKAPGAPAPPAGADKPAGPGHPPSAGLSDAAASRRAAAEALRARAEELRRSSHRAPPEPSEPPREPGRPSLSASIILPPARALETSLAESLDLEEGEPKPALKETDASPPLGGYRSDVERVLAENARRDAAEEALRALEVEATSHAAEVARARASAAPTDEGSGPSPSGDEHALQDAIETARREAFEAAKRELKDAARREAAEAARRVQAEARARQEAVLAAQREVTELSRREAEAAERAHAEADARRAAEEELRALRAQLAEERKKADERVATVMQRAAQEEEAADELRRLAEEEIRRRDEETARSRAAEEEKLRSAIESVRVEMEDLRRKKEEEAHRREEAEAALQKLEQARREAVARSIVPAAEEPGPRFTPPPFFAPFEGAEGGPPPSDPAEEAARRRVAAFRTGAAESAALEPAWPLPTQGPGEAPPPAAEEPGPALPQPIPQLRAGALSELPAPRLLALAARARLDGRLDFEGEVARSLWFEEGRVVGASSADPSERVEEVALRLGLITRDQHRQIAQAAAALPSRRAALLLLERGFLKPTELTGLVRRRTEEVVFGVFADDDARFRFLGVTVPPEERIALERGTLALAVEGVRRRWLAARVDALLGGPATLLAPVPNGPGPNDLGLSADERRVVALADGLRALEEIVGASPLDALSTRQVLSALVLTGALSVRALQAGRPAGQASAAIDLARVKDKLEQVRRADYFTVLGVGRLCTPHEVREAAERLRVEFEPRRFAGLPDEGLPARLAEIQKVVEDAREVLADDRLREEYLRGLGDAA